MFVVLKIQDFELDTKAFPLPVRIEKGKMVGYLPVYATKEDALADYPNAKLAEVEKIWW